MCKVLRLSSPKNKQQSFQEIPPNNVLAFSWQHPQVAVPFFVFLSGGSSAMLQTQAAVDGWENKMSLDMGETVICNAFVKGWQNMLSFFN